MLAWIFQTIAFAPLAPAPTPTFTLVWHDSAHLFPDAGLARLGGEMEALFRRNGLSITFHAAREHEDLLSIPEPRVNAVVVPREDWRFGLPPNTMAATLGEKGAKYTIFVFYPGVRRTLGYREDVTSPRQVAELSRALARVVAHEVIHVLAPERGHAESGLMSGNLGREELLADSIVLDPRSRESARDRIEALGSSLAAGSKFPIPERTSRSIVAPEVPFLCPSVR
jgi:hypothetical protein